MESGNSNILKALRGSMLSIIGIVLSSGITYFICHSSYDSELQQLKAEINDLQKKEMKAMVTQRISEQMEDIAYEQKEISDMQRDSAEKQRQIADLERGKAILAINQALDARMKAEYSAREADSMRVLAENQTILALRNQEQAENAKAQADTLLYRTIATSLAQNSVTQYSSQANLSRLLSYTSWYYTTNYGGNVYNQDIMKSLIFTSGYVLRNNSLKGSIRSIETKYIDGKSWIIGISDNGEIFAYIGDQFHVLSMNTHNIYRDMAFISDTNIALLRINGNISKIDISNAPADIPKELVAVNLSEKIKEARTNNLWRNISLSPDGTSLVVMSSKLIIWLDPATLAIKTTCNIDGEANFMGKGDSKLHFFCKDGKHYVSSKMGEITLAPSPQQAYTYVTSYYFDSAHGYHFYGAQDGSITIADNNSKNLSTIPGHSTSITCLGIFDNYLASTSYDSQIRFWDIHNPSTPVLCFAAGFSKWPLCFHINKKDDMIWIGNADGHINRFCIDPNKNAAATRKLITDEFTQGEWNHYIGPAIPYRTFMPESNEKGGTK